MQLPNNVLEQARVSDYGNRGNFEQLSILRDRGMLVADVEEGDDCQPLPYMVSVHRYACGDYCLRHPFIQKDKELRLLVPELFLKADGVWKGYELGCKNPLIRRDRTDEGKSSILVYDPQKEDLQGRLRLQCEDVFTVSDEFQVWSYMFHLAQRSFGILAEEWNKKGQTLAAITVEFGLRSNRDLRLTQIDSLTFLEGERVGI